MILIAYLFMMGLLLVMQWQRHKQKTIYYENDHQFYKSSMVSRTHGRILLLHRPLRHGAFFRTLTVKTEAKMKTRNNFYVLALLVCLCLSANSFAQSINPVAAQSIRLIETDKPIQALKLISDEVRKNPSPALWYYLGYAQIKNGQQDKSAASFDKGIQADEKEPLNYVGKGLLSMLNNKPEEAKPLFEKALAINKSKNATVLKAVAQAYLTSPKYANEAVNLLEKAKSLNGNDAETHLLLGDAFLAQNNGGLAVSSYETAASLDSKGAAAHYKIGLVYIRSKNFKMAEQSLTKAIAVDPEYTFAYKELGELYYSSKEADKAVRAYQNYLAQTDRPEVGKIRYAFFLFMAKDFSKANEVFKELVQSPDASAITYRFYAISLYEAGDYQQSRGAFENYFAKAAGTEVEASDYAYYGKLLLKQNEDSLALTSLQKSLAIDGKQVEIAQLQAETYFKLKKFAQAAEAYKSLIALRSKAVSQDYYTYGRACYFDKNYNEADAAFKKLIELQPNMTIGYLWEARTQASLDPETETGIAKPYYEKLVEKAIAQPDKSKTELVEAYSYLGYYHFVKQEMPLSKEYWQKVIALNPDDAKAKEALKAIK